MMQPARQIPASAPRVDVPVVLAGADGDLVEALDVGHDLAEQ
jgi:hypothetical protein